MRMIRGIFFAAILGIFIVHILSFVDATACTNTQLFMKTSVENAHGYSCPMVPPLPVVTPPVTWTTAQADRSCDGTNAVIKLSGNGNNSHAALPDQPTPAGYSEVCFKNIICDTYPIGTCIYTLTSSTNAHVGTCSSSGTKVYCRDKGPCNDNGNCNPSENALSCADCAFCGNGICEMGEPVVCSSDCGLPGPGPGPGVNCGPLNAQIIYPPQMAVFNVNHKLSFVQQTVNKSACEIYRWDFGDGQSIINYSANHSYATTGQKRVVLTIMNRSNPSQYVYDTSDILIIDDSANQKSYFFANILAPQENSRYNTSVYIVFNATGSYGVDIVGNNVRCRGGLCPSVYEYTKPDGTLDYKGIDMSAVPADKENPGRYSRMNFTWNFGDGTTYYNSSVNGRTLQKMYAIPGTYVITLWVWTYEGGNDPSNNGTDNVTIHILRKPGCSLDNRSFVDWNRQQYFTDEATFQHCHGLDEAYLTDYDNCCPNGWACQPVSGACEAPAGFNDPCMGICKTLISQAIGIPDQSCVLPIDAYKCGWHGEPENKCVLNGTCYPLIPDGLPPVPTGVCEKFYTLGDCVDNRMLMGWTAARIPPTLFPNAVWEAIGCVDGEKTGVCGQRAAQLAFFTLRQSIGVIVILIAAYLIINRKKIQRYLEKRK